MNVAFLLISATLAAEPLDQDALSAATAQVLDVLPWHQYVLRTQQRQDVAGTFAELSLYGSPQRFELPDASVQGGSLLRFGLGMGLGVGKPATGVAAFVGSQIDYGMANGAGIPTSDNTLAAAANGIVYGGLAVKGWTATAGILANQPLAYREQDGGVPIDATVDQMFTLYNQEGVAIGGVRAQRLGGDDVLAALRAEVAPERLLERLDLRRFGLFGIGLQRFASGVDPYQDDPGGPGTGPAHAELPLSAEDIAERGFRLQLTPEIVPRPTLRRLQAGYVWVGDENVLGGQVGAVNRGGRVVPSVQAFATVRPEWFKYFSFYGVPRIAFSYSYNTPDPVAFFEISGAHVLGVQYIYGPAEFARPLLPIFRPKGSTSASDP